MDQIYGHCHQTILMQVYKHSMAMKSNGDLYSWGGNQYGELGNGADPLPGSNVLTPAQIGAGINVAAERECAGSGDRDRAGGVKGEDGVGAAAGAVVQGVDIDEVGATQLEGRKSAAVASSQVAQREGVGRDGVRRRKGDIRDFPGVITE